MEKKTIGAFIAVLRKANGMTQRELAEKLNVSDKAVSRWERDECAPDLSLIPVIAEIFNITTDELLRGERKTQNAEEAEAPAEASVYIREKSNKQFQNLLRTKLMRLRERSMISYGLMFVGFIVALICNLVFSKAVLGFFLALVCYAAALITEICFLRRAKLDEDDAFDYGKWLTYQNDIVRIGERSFFVLWMFLGVTLPFLIAIGVSGVNAGLEFGAYLLLALIFGVIFLIVGYMLLMFMVQPRLMQAGLLFLTDPEKENHKAKRKLLKKTVLISGISALCLVLCAAFLLESMTALSTVFAERIRFDDYESYKAFMETPAGRLEDWDGGFEISYEGFEIIYTQPVSPSDEEWVDEDYTYYPKDTVTDKDGNVLCEYVRRNESVWVTEYSFDESADGLPIFVTTREAHRAVANVVECIAIALGILAAADVLLAIVIYIKKAKKYA